MNGISMKKNVIEESFSNKHKTQESTKTARRIWLFFKQQLTVLQRGLEGKTSLLAASLLGD